MGIPSAALATNEKVQRVVLAGLTLMYNPKTFPLLAQGIKANAPLPAKMAAEVAGVLHVVDQKSQNGLTPDVVAPASIMLLFDLAEFIRQSGAGNPTKEDIQAAIPILQKLIVTVFAKTGKAVVGQQQAQPPAQPPGPAGLVGTAQGA